MYKIKETSKYTKDVKKLTKSGNWKSIEPILKTVKKALEEKGRVIFDDENLNKRFSDHDITRTGNRAGYEQGTHDVHIKPDLLLLYIVRNNDTIELLRLGNHASLQLTASVIDDISIQSKYRLSAAAKLGL